MKKPGLDIIVGVGGKPRSMAPKPPEGVTGAPILDDIEDQPEEADEESKMGQILACLKRIETALGLDEEDPGAAADEGSAHDALAVGAEPR